MASDSEKGELSPEPASKRSNFTATPSPNKRLKTLTLDQSPVSSSKGKEKLDEMADVIEDDTHEAMVSDSKTCGICLSEEGNAIRGWIDSCNHYFCFVCIMEWSKVESRCPMCKRRFSTIRRPPKTGAFVRERIVNVPIRDQVYHPLGNVTTGPFDPYAQVQCSECHGMEDESLLLLCDLCDSAAHTYCVGLGATVPEGDWFCHDCSVSREHTNSKIDADYGYQNSLANENMVPVSRAGVSIFDIVREPNIPEVDRLPRITFPHSSQLSSSVSPDRTNCETDRIANFDARTLRSCRNVHNHVRALRENWNALRSGSLDFSSSLLSSGHSTDVKNKRKDLHPDQSNQPSLSFSRSSQKTSTKNSISSDSLNKRCPYDIDRAWKMMDIVKSVQQACASTSIQNQAFKSPFGKGNATKEATNGGSSFLASKGEPKGHKDLSCVTSEKNYNCQPLKVAHPKLNLQNAEREKPKRNMLKETLRFHEDSRITCPARYRESPSSRNSGTSIKLDSCHGNGEEQMAKKLFLLSNANTESDGTTCLISLVGSSKRDPGLSNGKINHNTFSFCGEKSLEGSSSMDKNSMDKMSKKNGKAKSEVQSLVKLNLKLLSRDKQLGINAFKEIARLATHTILAACGLEHSKSNVCSYTSSVCSHTNNIQQLQMSNLMPSLCRQCFFVFVKDVVNSIMSKKIAHTKTSCQV